MINIENSNSSFNLFKNVPRELLAKLSFAINVNEDAAGNLEVIILYGEPFERVDSFVLSLGGKAEDLGYGYAVVTIPMTQLVNLARSSAIQYIELPKSLTLTDDSSNRAACIPRARDTYSLDGEGVVIGFIDSGIDFTHPAFRNDDGTTRIEFIYDLSIPEPKAYDKAQINLALKERDPFSLVPVYDVTEHGTHVAGIACGGGRIDQRYYGVAPKSSIMMVKTGRGLFSLSTQIMRGLKFLIDKSKELKMPLVVNMSLSTNDGAHDGTSLLEQYINTIATHERLTIVIAAGNEGDAAHHVGGRLNDINTISFNVAGDETAVYMNIFKSILPKVSVELIAPTGVSSGEVIIEEGFKEGVLSQNGYRIFTSGPRPFDMSGEISVSLISSGNYIVSGVWRLIIRVLNKYNGIFDIWLPISEGLNQKTKFLQPTVDNTLGIPATVSRVVSVGSYNHITRNISPFSGRGRRSLYFESKPELVAPGEGITSAAPGRSFDTKTGTSMAAPHVSGICALIMQWGLVKGNDPYLFGDRLKYFLAVSAKKERREVDYPDPSWGYGEVCAYDAMNYIVDTLNIISNNMPRGKEDRQLPRFNTIEEFVRQDINSDDIVGVIVEFTNEERFLELNKLPNTTAVPLSESFGIIYLPIKDVDNIKNYASKLVMDINPAIFTLTNETPAEASQALNYHNNPYLTLNGNGVIIGIIDTGIDYLNIEFQKEDDTTRILKIWDQSIDNTGQDIYGIKVGVEYSEGQINEAIKLSKSGGDPYSIVPSRDLNGHGTMVAGLSAARGRNPSLVGIAPNSDLVIVKLKEVNRTELRAAGVNSATKDRFSGVDILSAMRYLSILSTELKKPIAILMPLGSNTGEHAGQGLLSGFINGFSTQIGSVCVVGTGNEGDTDTHTEGKIEKSGDVDTIELKVGKNQYSLNFEIWISQPDTMSISIVSPSGEVIDRIPPKSEARENIRFVYEGTIMSINYDIPNRTSGDELIIIRTINLKEGIWQFKLHGDYIVDGKYWAWLPQRSLLDSDTKFLRPSQYTTLTVPSPTRAAVSVAYYNQNNNATVGSSGRGFTMDGRIKPDIAAGGVGAPILRPGGGTGVASGSSVATSIVTGICALILQWAIIDGNRPEIYAEQIISYIIRGARMRGGDTYPNREWGYGMVDMTGILNAIRGNYSENTAGIRSSTDIEEGSYEIYNVGKLFVRKPRL